MVKIAPREKTDEMKVSNWSIDYGDDGAPAKSNPGGFGSDDSGSTSTETGAYTGGWPVD